MENDYKNPQNIHLIPASRFSIQQLTEIYNRTRIDYMVPMPMDANSLQEYIEIYDVDLGSSFVATSLRGEVLGIAMLGVRKNCAWFTRIGVIPNNRRSGVARLMVKELVTHANHLGIDFIMLEVIKGNTPAFHLFSRFGFKQKEELIILQGPFAHLTFHGKENEVQFLDRSESLQLLESSSGVLPWTNQLETMLNLRGVSGLRLLNTNGCGGWLVFHSENGALKHFVFKTEFGDPVIMAVNCLAHLHYKYPGFKPYVENIRYDDPHLPAFYQMGYEETFRRIEMWHGSISSDIIQLS